MNATLADNIVGGGPGAGALPFPAPRGAHWTSRRRDRRRPGGDRRLRDARQHDRCGNSGGGSASDIAGTVTGSHDLIGTGGSGGLTNGVNGNKVATANLALGTLADNGGPTPTVALLPGSAAIDAGSIALDAGQTTDQRGSGFVRVDNGTVDIGAYEVQPPPAVGPAVVVGATVDWGMASDPFYTAADGLRLLPAGRNTDLPWLNIDELQLTFNQPVTLTAAQVTISSEIGINYGPVTVTSNGMTDFITLARPIAKADRVTVSITSPTIAAYTRQLDVLPGDFNDNGVVKNNDATAIHNQWKGNGSANRQSSAIFLAPVP